MKRKLRAVAVGILVIGGGILQFQDTKPGHHSLLARIWGVGYTIVVLILLVGIAIFGVEYVQRRRARGRSNDSD